MMETFFLIALVLIGALGVIDVFFVGGRLGVWAAAHLTFLPWYRRK